jgi:hypothetical protein
MDGTEVSVFEQTNQIRLRRLLQRQHRVALETQVSLEILSNLTDQPLEWELPDQKFGTLLVLADFSASYIQYTPQLTPTKLESIVTMLARKPIKRSITYRRATVPGRYLWGFFTPPVVGADLRAA